MALYSMYFYYYTTSVQTPFNGGFKLFTVYDKHITAGATDIFLQRATIDILDRFVVCMCKNHSTLD